MMAGSKKETVIKKAIDRWSFLEDIDAPMWADLALEASSCVEDISDDWFNISHLFHQWSSSQLKSKFFHPGEKMLTVEVDSLEPASPQLPSSVSKSRGKDYKSKKWGGICLDNLLDKQHPIRNLSRRHFQAGSSYGQEVKPKLNVMKTRGMSSETLGSVFEQNARGNALHNCTKPKATYRNSVNSSSSVHNKTCESTGRSTITSENSQQQHKFMEVSSQSCDQKRELSSFRNISLKKKCVTKKASRVEIGGDGRQSRGRQSSSGKSSVGSSSNPGYEVKFTSKQQRDKNVSAMNLVVNNRTNPSNIYRASTVKGDGIKSSNLRGYKINLARPANHKAAKSMVQDQTIRLRALSPSRVNKQNTSSGANERRGSGKVNSLAGKGKENAARSVAVHQKCRERGVTAGGMFTEQRNTAGSDALKVQGKPNDEREAKNPIIVGRRTYLR